MDDRGKRDDWTERLLAVVAVIALLAQAGLMVWIAWEAVTR